MIPIEHLAVQPCCAHMVYLSTTPWGTHIVYLRPNRTASRRAAHMMWYPYTYTGIHMMYLSPPLCGAHDVRALSNS